MRPHEAMQQNYRWEPQQDIRGGEGGREEEAGEGENLLILVVKISQVDDIYESMNLRPQQTPIG